MVRSGGNIKIHKHNQGVKLPGLMKELVKRGYIYKCDGKIKYSEDGNQMEIRLGNIE